MNAENSAKKQRGRPFQSGQSGNPAGKPKGTRNRATIAAETLLDGEAESLTRKAIEMALAGDPMALRLCMERVLPPRKDRTISVTLPPLSGSDSNVFEAIVSAVADGRLTISEGKEMANLVKACQRSAPSEAHRSIDPYVIQVAFVTPAHDKTLCLPSSPTFKI